MYMYMYRVVVVSVLVPLRNYLDLTRALTVALRAINNEREARIILDKMSFVSAAKFATPPLT